MEWRGAAGCTGETAGAGVGVWANEDTGDKIAGATVDLKAAKMWLRYVHSA